MNADIQRLQEIANQTTPEMARRQLAEIETRQQTQHEQQLRTFDSLGELANQSLADFQAAKQNNDAALSAWLLEGQSIIMARQELERQAGTVFSRFLQWARAGLEAGTLKDPLSAGIIDNGSIIGQAQTEVRRLTGDSNLMTWPQVGSDITGWLLGIVQDFLHQHQLR